MARTFRIVALLAIAVAVIACSPQLPQTHAYSPNPSAKNVTLFWHYASVADSVGGIQTNYVMNSSANFDFQTLATAKANSFYKATGLAPITVDFYAYPNLAGPAVVNGTWQVFVSANASGYHPTTFNIEFREYALGSGTATWDSGLINPIVTSSIGAYVDVPVYTYNLTTPTVLAHTFSQGSTIDVSVTVNDGAAADARIWYDSPSYQSKTILPVVNPGQPAKIWTADSTATLKNSFPAQAQTIMVGTNVTDSFGGYDVNATANGTENAPVTLTVTSPSGSAIVTSQRMIQASGGIAVLNNLFHYNVTIAGTAGTYTATISSTDNSGNIEQLSYTFILSGSTSTPPPSLTTSLLIPTVIIIAVIVAIVGFLVMKRRKKSQPNST